MPKILLFRPTPRRNIPESEIHNESLGCDVLCVKYLPEHKAYHWARDYFLAVDEYDYLVIAPDDVVVLPSQIEQLKSDLESVEYPVLTGHCNVDEEDYPDGLHNITSGSLINDEDKVVLPPWLKPNEFPDEDIFPVHFVGFSLTAIRRDIVELIPFAESWGENPIRCGGSKDIIFSLNCVENSIPMVCDKRIDSQHLRKHGEHMVGKRQAKAVIFRNNEWTQLEKLA